MQQEMMMVVVVPAGTKIYRAPLLTTTTSILTVLQAQCPSIYQPTLSEH